MAARPRASSRPGADIVEREEAAAAIEAAQIGGPHPHHEGHGDPAMDPVYEAGGGEAEGFEQAEEDLRENAEHGQLGPRDPNRDAFTPEEQSDVANAEYAEADDARTEDRPDEP